jgi:hypothetical protein
MRLRLLDDPPDDVARRVQLVLRDGLRDQVLFRRGEIRMAETKNINRGVGGQKSAPGTTSGRASQMLVVTPEDLDALLVAHCRNAVTELPRGVLGTATAADFLAALPAACRMLLPDITGSGPAMFSVLVSHGLLPAMPSPRVLPAALALAATVSPLLERRSARQWTMWLARVREPGSAVAVAVRARTPDSQRSALTVPVTSRPLRSAALKAERDDLAEKLAQAQRDAEMYRADLATLQEQLVAREDHWAAKDQEMDTRLDRLQQRMAEMGREIQAATVEQARGQAEIAEIRRLCGLELDDPRTLPQLMQAVLLTLAEAEANEAAIRRAHAGAAAERDMFARRAERAENDLARARADLTLMRPTPRDQEARDHERMQPLLKELDELELELVQALAENELRRGRMLPPSEHEVLMVRQEAASTIGQSQPRGPTSR